MCRFLHRHRAAVGIGLLALTLAYLVVARLLGYDPLVITVGYTAIIVTVILGIQLLGKPPIS